MKKNNKGFTMAELLIVVAIIAVLVAIAIPVFTTQLKKAELATDLANTRAAYAEVVATKMANGSYTSGTSGKIDVGTLTVPLKHTTASVTDPTGSAKGKIVLTHKKDTGIKGSFEFDSDVNVGSVA